MAIRHMRAVAMQAALAVIATAPSAIAASFDGDWNLYVQSPDHCGTTSWNIAIRGGQVYYPQGRALGYPVGMAGSVSPSGVIQVNVAAGPRSATGTGRLGKLQGSGQWAGQGPSGTCAGIWIATRVYTYRASYGTGASNPYAGYPYASGSYVGYPYGSGRYEGYPYGASGPYVGYPYRMISR